mmetsp:Transcript_31755/g.76907  ORF Transcript_31755/g.76907 Transcript_31755/m.76907 type:complete len:96 (-) Transcript_31755:298-585(-)
MHHNDLFCLYQFPDGQKEALALHWKESGQHFELAVDPMFVGDFSFLGRSELNAYVWGAKIVAEKPRPSALVMNVAVGYPEALEIFCLSIIVLRTK